jgi:triosephosphate isomerase
MAQALCHSSTMNVASSRKVAASSHAHPRPASFVRVPNNNGRAVARDIAAMASKAKFFVGGNWKSNGTMTSVKQLINDLNAGSVPSDIDIVCSPPFIYLDYARSALSSKYQLSAQNCWVLGNGAYTGEITAEQLTDFGIPWVITGHSERRSLFGESSKMVAEKTAHAIEVGLSVIACIGETLEQRNSGSMFNVLDEQMGALISHVKDWSKVVIAYEPVWAIGTGVVASPEQAQEVHAYLRSYLSKKLGAQQAETIRIIYGGSVNDKNCDQLGVQEDIDGFLVGGASLQGPAFVRICNARS